MVNTNTEPHLFVSYVDLVGSRTLFGLGITPDRRITFVYDDDVNGPVQTYTDPFAVSNSDTPIRIRADASSDGTVSFWYGSLLVKTVSSVGFSYVGPMSEGYLMLFGDVNGFYRCKSKFDLVSILGSSPYTYFRYDLKEGRGLELEPSYNTGGGEDMTLRATQVAGLEPWGAATVAPANSFEWLVNTQWARRALPATSWTRVNV